MRAQVDPHPLLISPEFEGIKTVAMSDPAPIIATDQPRIRGD